MGMSFKTRMKSCVNKITQNVLLAIGLVLILRQSDFVLSVSYFKEAENW